MKPLLVFLAVITHGVSFSMNWEKPHVPGELFVKFADKAPLQLRKTLVENVGARIKTKFRFNKAVLLQVNDDHLREIAQKLSTSPYVEYVELNAYRKIFAKSNDPFLSSQYHLELTHAFEAWDFVTGSRKVKVAVPDTGVDYGHPEISPNYLFNEGEMGKDANGNDKRNNGIDDDANGFIDDWRGWDFVDNDNDPVPCGNPKIAYHGTFCASLIGAKGNNNLGVSGNNWESSLLGLRFLDDNGLGTLENEIKSFEYAILANVNIINASFGGDEFSQVEFDTIAELSKRGILLVAAAGNDTENIYWHPSYPSSYQLDNILSVAATNKEDNLASFSNASRRTVHLAAPGVNIYSLGLWTGSYNPMKSSGTSFSAPQVAGAAALVWSRFPASSMKQVKERILRGVDTIEKLKPWLISGGRLNLFKALEDDLVAPAMVQNVTLEKATITSLDLSFDPSGDDDDNGSAMDYEMRVSSLPITSVSDWENALPVKLTWQVAQDGRRINTRVPALPLNSEGYLVIRAIDNVGNRSELCPPIRYALTKVKILQSISAESITDLKMEPPWTVRSLADAPRVLTPSEEGCNYKNEIDASMVLPRLHSGSRKIKLVVRSQHYLEENFDFGLIEISTDGGKNWQTIKSYTGSQAWWVDVVSLPESAAKRRTLIRFRFVSDLVRSICGWFIDNISVVTEE
ncbi:MAG: S8 family serine peptidase [Deltaproteobacteria bacterium]|nr:S8 family serine peptidase [Deltaproteobacteria bacterium]